MINNVSVARVTGINESSVTEQTIRKVWIKIRTGEESRDDVSMTGGSC